ncbi:hypothetical protein ACLIKE_06980 [Ferroplasma acidiphilum]|uniref:Uncharacterized protein n=1 Tax=Ferroplasma acidiphilum TaxID=74969 RepID=A0A7K4FN49_9ARCH|nr:hypothetical protein [Ferroplasma acidiphilum]NOL60241.1 hypothetical protein [Ferroplasma acidiphilum]
MEANKRNISLEVELITIENGYRIIYPIDDYDKIIIKRILELAVEFFNSKPKELSISPFVFGLNEIAHLVKDDMSYITAQKHINKLIKENYLIDLNEKIKQTFAYASTFRSNEDYEEIEDIFTRVIIAPILVNLIEKYEKSKKRLILNFEKLNIEKWLKERLTNIKKSN